MASAPLSHLNSGGAALPEPRRSRMPHELHMLSDTEILSVGPEGDLCGLSPVCRLARAQRPERRRERPGAWHYSEAATCSISPASRQRCCTLISRIRVSSSPLGILYLLTFFVV